MLLEYQSWPETTILITFKQSRRIMLNKNSLRKMVLPKEALRPKISPQTFPRWGVSLATSAEAVIQLEGLGSLRQQPLRISDLYLNLQAASSEVLRARPRQLRTEPRRQSRTPKLALLNQIESQSQIQQPYRYLPHLALFNRATETLHRIHKNPKLRPQSRIKSMPTFQRTLGMHLLNKERINELDHPC